MSRFNEVHRASTFGYGSADEILKRFERDPTSRNLAIAAKCIQCRANAEGVRSCKDRKCALWLLQPFQCNAVPRSAPHIELRCEDLPADNETDESLE